MSKERSQFGGLNAHYLSVAKYRCNVNSQVLFVVITCNRLKLVRCEISEVDFHKLIKTHMLFQVLRIFVLSLKIRVRRHNELFSFGVRCALGHFECSCLTDVIAVSVKAE